MSKVRRLYGQLAGRDGKLVDIRNKHTAEAIMDRDAEIEDLKQRLGRSHAERNEARKLADSNREAHRIVHAELIALRSHWFVRLGRRFGVLRSP